MGKGAIKKPAGKTGQKKGDVLTGARIAPDGTPYSYVQYVTSNVSAKGAVSFKSKIVPVWSGNEKEIYS